MLATIRTELPASSDKVWQALLKRDSFLYVTRGMLGFRGSDRWPELFSEGLQLDTRLVFFHLIPGWRHTLRLIRVDAEKLTIASEEGGGLVRTWNHRICLETRDSESCGYTDEIDIRASVLTPLVWLFAQAFYRYRQRRWRRLAASLLR